MSRAIIIVMDSFGIGGAPDAAAFGDEGSNTLGHILENVSPAPGTLPNLARLGLFHALDMASGHALAARHMPAERTGFFAVGQEVSKGKDTPSGHWEIAGVPVTFDWGYFPQKVPAFPAELLDAIYKEGGLEGSLANRHASGTEIIAECGREHMRTGQPIFYTSADSVFQIAAHEDETVFGLTRLYGLCETVKLLVEPYNIGRVIARPFVGMGADDFERTGNRRDYAVPPPEPTILDRALENGRRVIAVGKIGDIFAHKGISEVRKVSGNAAIGEATLEALVDADDGDLIFANFVDFDMLYGHRRDPQGYFAALEAFDAWLPSCLGALRDGDLLVITADHGCDPTWTGSDHTRERVPIIGMLKGAGGVSDAGIRETFADIGATVADHLGLVPGPHGTSFLADITDNA